MKRLAQIEKEVASIRKSERALAPVRAKATEQRVKNKVTVVRQQQTNGSIFAVLFNAPASEKKRTNPKLLSKSARRRIKLHKQFEALADVEHSIVRRKHH